MAVVTTAAAIIGILAALKAANDASQTKAPGVQENKGGFGALTEGLGQGGPAPRSNASGQNPPQNVQAAMASLGMMPQHNMTEIEGIDAGGYGGGNLGLPGRGATSGGAPPQQAKLSSLLSELSGSRSQANVEGGPTAKGWPTPSLLEKAAKKGEGISDNGIAGISKLGGDSGIAGILKSGGNAAKIAAKMAADPGAAAETVYTETLGHLNRGISEVGEHTLALGESLQPGMSEEAMLAAIGFGESGSQTSSASTGKTQAPRDALMAAAALMKPPKTAPQTGGNVFDANILTNAAATGGRDYTKGVKPPEKSVFGPAFDTGILDKKMEAALAKGVKESMSGGSNWQDNAALGAQIGSAIGMMLMQNQTRAPGLPGARGGPRMGQFRTISEGFRRGGR